jgi:serine O-acetyltransferase
MIMKNTIDIQRPVHEMMNERQKPNMSMKAYRAMNWLWRKHIPVLPTLIRFYIRVVFSMDISPKMKVGKNVVFAHNGLGCVFNSKSIIGDNVWIFPNVTLAARDNRGRPIIEDNVFIGPGAIIIGGVKVGKGATIGANSVVLNDVPAGALVVAPLAYIKERKTEQ